MGYAATTSRRRNFLRDSRLAAAALIAPQVWAPFAWNRAGQNIFPGTVASGAKPDYSLEISEIDWELARKKKIRTTAYNGQIPGPLLRITEGKPVTIAIANRLDREEIVHWHGQWIPVGVDGSMEEGSPMILPGGSTVIQFVPKPAGLHWYHTHAMAHRDLKRGLYTGSLACCR